MIGEKTRLYQAALEARRTQRDRLAGVLSAEDELARADGEVDRAYADLLDAYYKQRP